jgi:hypothetical protein
VLKAFWQNDKIKKRESSTMKNNNIIHLIKRGFSIFAIIILMTFYDCSSMKKMSVTPFYKFEYQGKNYRIRSISSTDKNTSRNEIIGDDFVAIDKDRDGIIDMITIGKGNLIEVQNIYEYALNLLDKTNKLKEVDPNNDKFLVKNSEFYYEIRSFRIEDDGYLNQLKITPIRQSFNRFFIIIDENADGKLDKVIKGNITTEDFQSKYSALIKKGLLERKLVKADEAGTIIVKN